MKKAVITAAALSAAMSFSACNNYNGDVYGPPPEVEWVQDMESETAVTYAPAEEEAPDTENAKETDTESTGIEEAVSESTDTEEAEE